MKPADILLAISVPVIWGLGFTLAKVAFVYAAFPPVLLMALRFSLTALVLVWFVRPPWGYMRAIFFIALVSATIQYALTFTGLNGLKASTAIIVVQLEFPFMALLASIFLKDHLGWRRVAGIALAFCGILLIAGQPEVKGSYVPVFLVMGGALTWAIGQIMIKTQLKGEIGGFTLIAWVAVFASPQLFLTSWLIEGNQIAVLRDTGLLGWGVVVYMGLVMTALGYAIWYHILGRFPVSQVGPFLLLLPVTSIAGSVLMLGERLNRLEMAGAGIVILGVWFVTKRARMANPEGV